MRSLGCILAIALAMGTPGCANREGTGALNSGAAVLRNAAQAVLAGRAYDRGTLAAQREDTEALVGAADELRHLGETTLARDVAGQAAEEAVEAAVAFDMLGARSSGAAREKWRARAATEYRKALSLAPDFDSQDPDRLNALGYFLAERGTTPDDFKQAERLTRNSLAVWDKQLAQLDKADPRLPLLRFRREVEPHDSLAWALYRQGRYKEAQEEQTAAIAAARAASAASKISTGPIASELYFHLGEIYRALHRPDEARRQYQQAVRLNPDDAVSRRSLEGLQTK